MMNSVVSDREHFDILRDFFVELRQSTRRRFSLDIRVKTLVQNPTFDHRFRSAMHRESNVIEKVFHKFDDRSERFPTVMMSMNSLLNERILLYQNFPKGRKTKCSMTEKIDRLTLTYRKSFWLCSASGIRIRSSRSLA